MSFFARVLSRAAAPGCAQLPLAHPKGGSLLARQDSGEDDIAQPLRRQADTEEEVQALQRQAEEAEEVQALRRQTEPDEQKEQAQPLRRQAEDEEAVQALRRQADTEEEGEQAQPLRRQAEDEEEDQALRCQTEEDGEEQAQPLRRLTPPAAENLDADNSPQPDENASEPELAAMQALSRETVLSPPGVGAVAQAPVPAGPPAATGLDTIGLQEPAAMEPHTPGLLAQEPFSHTPGQAQHTAERPRVTIDQIDVIIHEEAAAATGAVSPIADLGRAFKAKYLGGL
jgi:hypothetical protein